MRALPPGTVCTESERQPLSPGRTGGDVMLHVTGMDPTSTTRLEHQKQVAPPAGAGEADVL